MDASEGGRPGPVANALHAREALTASIVAQINTHGYFLAHVDPEPHQQLIDLRWAAQVAGRVLGRKTHTWTSAIGDQRAGKVTVLVAPDGVRTVTDAVGNTTVRTLLDDLLVRQRLVGERGPATA